MAEGACGTVWWGAATNAYKILDGLHAMGSFDLGLKIWVGSYQENSRNSRCEGGIRTNFDISLLSGTAKMQDMACNSRNVAEGSKQIMETFV